MNKKVKTVALTALVGTLFQFGGCLNLNQVLRDAAWYAAFEFVTDNDGVFDLFESGAVAAE